MNKITKFLALIGSFFISNAAFAHSAQTESISFLSGFLHPIMGWDHLLTLLLVSFWSVFVLKKVWLGPIMFMGGILLGILLGLAQYALVWFEIGISISIIGMGVLIYFNQRFNFNIVIALLAVFGIFHGYAHSEILGNAYATNSDIIIDLCGLLVSTSLLHSIGLFFGKKAYDLNFPLHRSVGISAAFIGFGTMTF